MVEQRTATGWTGGLADEFLAGLSADPGRTALQVGEVRWRYSDLYRAASGLAYEAVAGAAGPVARLGVLGGNGATPAVGILAALLVGAAAVPLNPGFPLHRTLEMIDAAELSTVLVDERLSSLRAALTAARPELRCLGVPNSPPGGPAPQLDPRTIDPRETAYLMFTSGSTGRPKGVPVSHGNVQHFLAAARSRHPIHRNDVVVQTFEPTFDLFMYALLMGWRAGATQVAMPSQVLRRLPSFLAEHRVSVWFSVPSTIRLARRLGVLAPGSMPTLARSMFCGEPLQRLDADAWAAAAPRTTVENLYGPTELTIACSSYVLDGRDSGPDAPGNGVVPIGELYDGLRAVLVDERLQVTADEGELCVAGPQMFGGYLDPADDADRFVSSGAERFYRTGDRVRRQPGVGLVYLGRLDHQIKVRGYRIELLEIEHALRAIDGVDTCAVVPLDRHGETTLVAVYSGEPAEPTALLRAMAQRLPEYMVPSQIRRVDQLPLNSNGKVDRPLLAERVEAAP
jgi:amino acid adenylation domain-containing protein